MIPVVGGGAKLSGTAVLPTQGPRATARYVLVADASWRTVELDVRLSTRDGEVRRRLTSDTPGRWRGDGEELPALDGCLDVSLGFSPVALTPLIRRVDLARGERADVDVVDIRLPDLAAERTRVGIEHDARERWLHHVGSATYALHVGPQGLITEYEDAWTAVALG